MNREKLIAQIRALWNMACRHDGIDPAERFVVFSADNPYTDRYNQAVIALQTDMERERRKEQAV